jgi:hypothetical protein
MFHDACSAGSRFPYRSVAAEIRALWLSHKEAKTWARESIERRRSLVEPTWIFLEVLPDLRITIEHLVAEGDMVATRVTSNIWPSTLFSLLEEGRVVEVF